MNKAETKNIKIEIKARKIVIKKLDTAIKSLDRACRKIEAARADRIESLSEYKSESELQEAYGWEFITEEEYYKLLEAMRSGTEKIEQEISPEEIALSTLKEWKGRMESDIDSLKFDLLPKKEADGNSGRKRTPSVAERRATEKSRRRRRHGGRLDMRCDLDWSDNQR